MPRPDFPIKIRAIRVQGKGLSIQEVIKVMEGKILRLSTLEKIRQKTLDACPFKPGNELQRKRSVEEHTEPWRTTKRYNIYNILKETSFVTEDKPGHFMLGIGKRTYLNEHAPYWYLLNYGGKVPPGTYGYFGRGQPQLRHGHGEVFHYTGKKGYNTYRKGVFWMQPNKILTPSYFLNTMAEVMKTEIIRYTELYRRR